MLNSKGQMKLIRLFKRESERLSLKFFVGENMEDL